MLAGILISFSPFINHSRALVQSTKSRKTENKENLQGPLDQSLSISFNVDQHTAMQP